MSSAQNFGITSSGFVTKPQQQIISEMVADLQATFGTSVNLQPESFIGQLYYILSERESLLWDLVASLYVSQFPSGAESIGGVAVDNILALSNMQRLSATPTVTSPTPVAQVNGITLYGLLLFGVAGTLIPAGSIVQTSTSPAVLFTTDNDATIAAAINGQQTIVLSNAPTSGTWVLALTTPGGNTLTTSVLSYATLAASTTFTGIPTSQTYQVMVDGTLTPAIAANSTTALVAALNNAGANITASSGSAASLVAVHGTGYIPAIDPNPYAVSWAGNPTTGTFSLSVGTSTTGTIAAGATASQVQAAIVAAGYPTAKVAISNANPIAYAISFGYVTPPPTLAFASNATGVTPNPVSNVNSAWPSVTASVQGVINALVDTTLAAGQQRPFTDVVVTPQGQNFLVSFGAAAPATSQPTTAAQPMPVIASPATSTPLSQGSTLTNISAVVNTPGAPAQAIATATCTVDGASPAPAGSITVIGTPKTGWSGVTNEIDAVLGTDDESDADALARRTASLYGNANGPLSGIIGAVEALPGVTGVYGFENTSQAALQTMTFASPPTTGYFQIVLAAGTTAQIACAPDSYGQMHPTAVEVQTAISAIAAYASVRVAGSTTYGFSIDFSGALGAQSQPLIAVPAPGTSLNTTGVAIATAFGRSPNSFEIVVQGGSPSAIAQAIYNKKPAGIAAYASPASVTTGSVAAGSTQLSVATSTGIAAGLSIFGLGVPSGTTVVTVAGTTVTMSNQAIATTNGANYTFSNAVQVIDQDGNPQLIGFSRPSTVLFYVSVSLITDTYRIPGNPASGINPQSRFNPALLPAMQQAIVNAGNAVPIGGLVIGSGSGGIVGSFNSAITGVVGYTLAFGPAPSPTQNVNVQLLPTQDALFEVATVTVAYI